MSALFGGIGSALGNPVYRRFWASNAICMIGRWFHRVAVGWLTWELTESTSWLGAVAFADTFPMVVLSIVGGAIADRVGYLRVMRVTQVATLCIAALFATLTLSGHITIWLVLILTVFYGSLEALTVPARVSMVHRLVPQRDLAPAIALASATFNAARVVGPAISGPLILWVGTGPVIAIGALSFLQFFLVLLTLPAGDATGDHRLSGDLAKDIWSGIRYVLLHPGIRFLMILLGASGLLIRPFIELLPGFSARVFGLGPDGLAILLSSIGIGAMCSCMWLAQRGETAGLTRLVTAGLLISGAALFLFTLTGHIWLAGPVLTVVGFFLLVGGVGSQTLIQNAVESGVRARVMSLFVVISWGLPALGALAMGWIAEFLGLQATIGAGAAMTFAVWLWARRRGPQLAPDLENVDVGGGEGR